MWFYCLDGAGCYITQSKSRQIRYSSGMAVSCHIANWMDLTTCCISTINPIMALVDVQSDEKRLQPAMGADDSQHQ